MRSSGYSAQGGLLAFAAALLLVSGLDALSRYDGERCARQRTDALRLPEDAAERPSHAETPALALEHRAGPQPQSSQRVRSRADWTGGLLDGFRRVASFAPLERRTRVWASCAAAPDRPGLTSMPSCGPPAA